MKSQLNFVSPNAEGEVKFVLDKGWTGTHQRAFPVEVHDARPQAAALSLDREGFVLTRLECDITDYSDPGQLAAKWQPQVEQKLLELTGGVGWFCLPGRTSAFPKHIQVPTVRPFLLRRGQFIAIWREISHTRNLPGSHLRGRRQRC